ncbi:MAG: TlpA family protein disulfide reductase, partial [Gammaproteobacteria bacterium]|nr:TlpA family protein disulfide reductase [Gammaproteobacteria bacterium]
MFIGSIHPDATILDLLMTLQKIRLFLLVVAISVPAYADRNVPPPIGEGAPGWALEKPDGAVVNFPEDAKGNPSIVLFWATWCPYCKALMPHLQRVYDDFRAAGLNYYGVNVWEDGDPVA